MVDGPDLTESLQDYLEAILQLQEENKVARTKEIAELMGVSLASVTASLRRLGDMGLINYAPYQFITLTDEGEAIAREILRKHNIIKDFLIRVLTMEPAKADMAACRIEHAMDKADIKKLVSFVSFLDTCPRAGEDWFQNYASCVAASPTEKECKECLAKCTTKLMVRQR